MKLFIDTANIEEIREANNMGLIDGVTTNPTLIVKEGGDFENKVKEICSIVEGPVSAEVISLEKEEMLKEARELAAWAENIAVKIPMTPEGLKAVKKLADDDIDTNVTLVFSPSQALMAAKAGATFVSPFVGRLDDRSKEGMRLIERIRSIYDNYNFNTQVITASVRSPRHVVRAAEIGSDIATIPFDILQKLTDHPLTEIGINRFISDWEEAKK